MTSKASEAFVYITLPGETKPVTAARFVLGSDPRGVPWGRFIYGRSYLQNAAAVPIDPVELHLTDHVYETRRLDGIFGALRDASPDYWGRRVIEKHAGAPRLGEIDYLLESPDDRAGALSFGRNAKPPAPRRRFNKTLDLEKLQAIADRLVRNDLVPDVNDLVPDAEEARQVQDLLLLETSMGGARPKAVVEDKAGLWIAKFNRFDDRWNSARVEYAMMVLARDCGLTVAESRLATVAGQDILLVKRFDREKSPDGYRRARMISALTLLSAEETRPDRWSYVVMAEEMRRVVAHPRRNAADLFRRMLFNALISNRDDHPRNHALIAPGREWSLSPAYDLTPSPDVASDRRDLAMVCGDAGRWANAANILSQHGRFLLGAEDAHAIVATMTEQVERTWYDTARRCGVSEQDAETIRRAFVYPGFSASLPG